MVSCKCRRESGMSSTVEISTLERVANVFRSLNIFFDQLEALSSLGITGRYCICHRYQRRINMASTGPLSLEEPVPRLRRSRRPPKFEWSPFAPCSIRTHPSPESPFKVMSYCICRGICRHNRVHHVYGCIVHSRRHLSRSDIQASSAHLTRYLIVHLAEMPKSIGALRDPRAVHTR
jgi:hypothetical protein